MQIDWTIGIYILNVIILYVALRLLLYKPVLKFMKKRENMFANKVDELDEREKGLIRQKEQYDHMMAEADGKAAAIITKSNDTARENAKEIMDNAKVYSRDLVMKAKREIEAEKMQTRTELKAEITDMAVNIAEKVLEREISVDDNRKIIDEFFERVG